MDSPVRSSTHTTAEAATTSNTYLRGLYYVASGVAGSIVLDDGVGGSTELTVATPALATEVASIDLPGRGIRFKNGIDIATLSNVTSLTLIYEV